MQREINDLHAEIDLYIDENNNTQSDAASNTTSFEARLTDKGRPYNSNVREIYYSLLSKGVSVANMGSIIRTVLSLVDIEITNLPSVSTAANMSSDICLVAQQHLTEVLGNDDTNYTLQRDATTKTEHHYYANQLATKDQTLTIGITEVLDVNNFK